MSTEETNAGTDLRRELGLGSSLHVDLSAPASDVDPGSLVLRSPSPRGKLDTDQIEESPESILADPLPASPSAGERIAGTAPISEDSDALPVSETRLTVLDREEAPDQRQPPTSMQEHGGARLVHQHEQQPPRSLQLNLGISPAPTTGGMSRFATPPIQFASRRSVGVHGPIRPRNLGEFLEAAKSRPDALLSAPAVQRRLAVMNFQPRRSARIAMQPGGLNSEQKAVRNLLRKLGLVSDNEVPSEAAFEAYRKLFETPLTDEMVQAIAELYGWSLATIRGCSPPISGLSGGRLMEA